MSRQIIATLKTIEVTPKKELLEFDFQKPIHIDLTSDDPEQLKQFFSDLLTEYNEDPFSVKYDNSENRNDLFADISEKYILDLDNELKALASKFPKQGD